jgi:hypothetical protein
MKLKCTHFLYLLLISFASYSQPQANKGNTTVPKKTAGTAAQVKINPGSNSSNPAVNATAVAYSSPLTGVWRGFFTSGMGFFQEKYRYEVQIGQLNNNGIKGVTYSYKTTVFYGKANLAGMYTPSTKNLVLKENKLVEVKMSSGDACLMTCYLEYSKVGEVEILEGTFTSVNITTHADCGSGRVYLEKVPESDFYKEDFIRDYEARKKNPPVNATPPKVARQTPKTQPKTKPKTTTAADPKKPIKKDDAVKKDQARVNVPTTPQKIDDNIVVKPLENKVTPKELKERENKVAKLIEAEGDEITIELYDNGQIDNDTITVYHNKRAVIVRKRLCHQPITLHIKVDPDKPRNEFVMVAENLGSIPPNTALMIVTVGKQRYEVTLTSTNQKNAMVIVDCKPLSREGR